MATSRSIASPCGPSAHPAPIAQTSLLTELCACDTGTCKLTDMRNFSTTTKHNMVPFGCSRAAGPVCTNINIHVVTPHHPFETIIAIRCCVVHPCMRWAGQPRASELKLCLCDALQFPNACGLLRILLCIQLGGGVRVLLPLLCLLPARIIHRTANASTNLLRRFSQGSIVFRPQVPSAALAHGA